MNTEYIYVLELNGGHYYIGKTKDIARRFNEHKSQKGCSWTKQHCDYKIIEIYENNSLFDEDKYTLEYMNMMGIENVRGGSYSNPILSVEQRNNITRALRNANNLCMTCGGSDHYADMCGSHYPKFDPQNDKKEDPSVMYVSPTGTAYSYIYEDSCKRCGRNNHTITKCFAKSDINGNIL